MTNSLLSPFVFPAFPSLLLFFSGVTTGQEGKYFSVSYSLIGSHSNSIHTLYFNPSPHICLILLWLWILELVMEFGLLCVCINQNKFCLSAYHVISQWILSHIAITQLAPILLICKNIYFWIISDNMSLNKVVFCFSKAMETMQQERFDEFGYTYIAPRWVVLTFTIQPLYTIQEIPTDQCCFFREYCKELKLSLNNTQFLLDFNQYIDRNTPDACESCIFFSVISHLCWFPALFVLILHIHPEQQMVCCISMCVYVFVHCIFYSLSWSKRFSTCKSWSQGQSMTGIITIS